MTLLATLVASIALQTGTPTLVLKTAVSTSTNLYIFNDHLEVRRKASLQVKDILNDWLDKDEVWGGHKPANDLRYTHRNAGGVTGEITQAMPVGTGALIILSWHASGPSATPVIAQQLAYVRVALPEILVDRVQNLSGPFAGSYRTPAAMRLVTRDGRPVLYNGGNFYPLDKMGKPEAALGAGFEDKYVRGFVAGRYAVMVSDNPQSEFEIGLFDVVDKKRSVIYSKQVLQSASITLKEFGVDSVWVREENSDGSGVETQIGVPSGKVIATRAITKS